MSSQDPFESRLRGLAERQVPVEWRQEILAAARAQTKSPAAAVATSNGSFWPALKLVLWPHPRAWAGLAAAWVVILALSWAAREPAWPILAAHVPTPSPQLRELLRKQEQLLAELTGPTEPARPVPAKPPATQPHSERQRQSFNV